MRGIDPDLPLTNVSTQLDQIEGRFAQERLFAEACAWFGALALLLACIGLFGLMSYSVSRRTNEIGIRMALGAERLTVMRLVMSESMALVGLGLAAGLVLAFGVSRFVAALLFGVDATDPVTFVAVSFLMLAVAALASYLPANRAARVDPAVALRKS